jgi:hypothetical protein
MCKESGNGGVQVESLGYAIACKLLLTSSIFQVERDGEDRSPGLHLAAEGIYDFHTNLRDASVFSTEPNGGEGLTSSPFSRWMHTRAEEYCRRIRRYVARLQLEFIWYRTHAEESTVDCSAVRAPPGIDCRARWRLRHHLRCAFRGLLTDLD